MAEEHFYYSINMHGLEVRNHRMHLLATDPTTPNEGDLWFNSTDHIARVRDNTEIRNLFSPDDDFYNRLADKTVVVDADELLIADSEDTYAYKKITKSNLVLGLGLVSNAFSIFHTEAGTTTITASGEDTVYFVGDGSIIQTVGNIIGANEISLSFANQSASLVFSGPSSGGTAIPTFRSMVDNDMPASYNPSLWDAAYTHSQTITGNPHGITMADLGYTIVTVVGDPGSNGNIPSEKAVRDFATPKLLVLGTFIETFDARVTSTGTVVTMSLEQTGGGDLTMQFSDGNTFLDCDPTPQTIGLTVGTDIAPQANYIYVLQSTKVLTKSISSWPVTEHIKVGYFFVGSAAYVATDGPLINQNWNDHLSGTDNMGHLTHISERARRDAAHYFSGIDGSGFDDYTTSAASSVTVQCTSGVVYQIHTHSFAAKDTSGTDDVHIVNHNTTPYLATHNLYDVVNDASGGTLTNKYFNIVLWGTINKSGEYSPLFINLPTGSYNTLGNAQNDVDNYDVFSMPREFFLDSSTGFLIARLTFRKTGTSWTYYSTVDLRGQNPLTAGGAAGAAITSFSDNQFEIYNVLDNTKVFNFDASSIATATTRTITMPDVDLTLINYNGTNAVFYSANKIYLDGGVDTYITEASANKLHTVVGDNTMVRVTDKSVAYGQQTDENAPPGRFAVNYGNYYFRTMINPPAPTAALITTSGLLSDGLYRYAIIYVTDEGDSGVHSFYSNQVTVDPTHQQINLTNIPIAPDEYNVSARKIYRTLGGGNIYILYRVTTINDNTTTSFVDNVPDGSLDTADQFYRKRNDAETSFYKDAGNEAYVRFFYSDAYSTIMGTSAAYLLTTGNSLVAFGSGTARNTTTGGSFVAIGYSAMYANISGSNNVAIGYAALYYNKTGNHNTAIGTYACSIIGYTATNYTVSIGGYAGGGGSSSVSIGHKANRYRVGISNVAIGYESMQGSVTYTLNTGTYNTAVGYRSGTILESGSYNIFLGGFTGDAMVSGARNILIGSLIDASTTSVNDEFRLGYSTTFILEGSMASGDPWVGTSKYFKTDSIVEYNAGVGVTVEQIVLKDGGITLLTGATVNEIETALTDDATHMPTSAAVYAAIMGGLSYWDRTGTTLHPGTAGDNIQIDGGTLTVNTIGEYGAGVGITVDGLLIKDYGLYAPDGVASDGASIIVQAGDPVGATNDGGTVTIKAGDALLADSASIPGGIYLNPGNQYSTNMYHTVWLGSSVSTATAFAIGAEGTELNIHIAIAPKGSGQFRTLSATSHLYNSQFIHVGSVATWRTISSYSLVIHGGDGNTNESGQDATIRGGAGNGTGDGGDLFLYAGPKGTTGAIGGTYFGTGAVGYLPSDDTQTTVVAYDTTTGLLSYRTVSSLTGTIPVDDILDWNGTAYAPYAAQTTGAFDSGVVNPISAVNRLNFDGEFYAYNLYAGNATDHITITSGGQLLIYTGAANQMIFQPYVSDGAGAYAYFFDTENTLSIEGSLVARFASNGVIRMGIHGQGEWMISARSLTALPTPAVTYGLLYQDSADDKLYFKTSATTYDLTSTGGAGTVTSVSAGNGMTFTTITASGAVTMGTPGTLTSVTSNAVTTDSHTHAVTGLPAYGSDNQIPYTNSGGTGFDYSPKFIFDGNFLTVAQSAAGTASAIYITHSDNTTTGSAALLSLNVTGGGTTTIASYTDAQTGTLSGIAKAGMSLVYAGTDSTSLVIMTDADIPIYLSRNGTPQLEVTSDGIHMPNSVGIGTDPVASWKLWAQGTATAAYHVNPVGVFDDRALAAGTGGGVTFGGIYTSIGGYTSGGFIRVEKETAGTGEYGYDLLIGNRIHGSSPAPRIKLTATGEVELYSITTKRFETSSTGVTITGTIVSTLTTAYQAWSDYPVTLGGIPVGLRINRDSTTYGVNDFNGILIAAKSGSAYTSYGLFGVQALSASDQTSRFNFLLRGVASADYETVFSMDYNSTYYWKVGSASSDITHHLRQLTTTVAVFGWDDSLTAFQIHTGTAFTIASAADFTIAATGYIYLGNIQNVTNTNYLRYNNTTGEVTWLSSSDIRLKENIKPWEPDSLSFLVQQDLIKFDRKDGSSFNEIGWNANQMHELMPDMTWIDDKGYYNFKDAHFPMHFHRAIVQLNEVQETHEEKIIRLEKRVTELENQKN